MEEQDWTPERDGELLRLLTESETKPDKFPSDPRGKVGASVTEFFDSVVAVFQHRGWTTTVKSVRERTSYFLGKLEPLSEALRLLVRTTQAAQRQGVTVQDLQERVAQRDQEREAVVRMKSGFWTSGDSSSGATEEVGASSDSVLGSQCMCAAADGAPCPLRGQAHFLLCRCPAPTLHSAAEAVDTFTIRAGEATTEQARQALLEALSLGHPSPAGDKEQVYVALLRAGLSGVLVDATCMYM